MSVVVVEGMTEQQSLEYRELFLLMDGWRMMMRMMRMMMDVCLLVSAGEVVDVAGRRINPFVYGVGLM